MYITKKDKYIVLQREVLGLLYVGMFVNNFPNHAICIVWMADFLIPDF